MKALDEDNKKIIRYLSYFTILFLFIFAIDNHISNNKACEERKIGQECKFNEFDKLCYCTFEVFNMVEYDKVIIPIIN